MVCRQESSTYIQLGKCCLRYFEILNWESWRKKLMIFSTLTERPLHYHQCTWYVVLLFSTTLSLLVTLYILTSLKPGRRRRRFGKTLSCLTKSIRLSQTVKKWLSRLALTVKKWLSRLALTAKRWLSRLALTAKKWLSRHMGKILHLRPLVRPSTLCITTILCKYCLIQTLWNHYFNRLTYL